MGPLDGVRIVELAGIGPAPFCGMLLADMGAEVIQVARPSSMRSASSVDQRGRRSLVLDLKDPAAADVVLRLCETADALIEGFRPGVMERLGLGPDVCLQRNPKLVYGRMTGWGQDGPWAKRAGHDINYLALSGALFNLGRHGERPAIPLNFIADYGGGAMFLAFGLLCGILESQRSGQGQVVDAAMIDGVAALQALHYQFYNQGIGIERGSHFLGGGHHSYEVYETSDGEYVAIGALEPAFYAELIEKLELDPQIFGRHSAFSEQSSPQQIMTLKAELTRVFRTRTREEWCEVFEESDACFAPVLRPHEAAKHPHHQARETFIERDGQLQHNAAPRFSRTPAAPGTAPQPAGMDSVSILQEIGCGKETISRLIPGSSS